jgi:hypothetical protein
MVKKTNPSLLVFFANNLAVHHSTFFNFSFRKLSLLRTQMSAHKKLPNEKNTGVN